MKHSSKRSFLFRRLLALSLALAVGIAVVAHRQATAEPAAKVMINGKMAGVFFNDGDSFRVLKGPKKGAKARLAGFNTLESHGAVHQWGDWTFGELYTIAKMATLNGRKGTWSCTTDGDTDTYGRMLLHCEGLAADQIRKGLAHAMTIDDNPSKPRYLEAQRDAIENKRGMWAHGVPEFVLTSLHSIEEDVEGHGTYNRLVSSADGHSIKWRHTNRYDECETVCLPVYANDEALLPAVLEKLKAEGADLIGEMTDEQLLTMLGTYQRIRLVDRPAPEKHRVALNALLLGYATQGLFGTGASSNGSCVLHVPLERRFGGTRAACLKK
ncbi:MAG: thermonuclease family protein [Myxococcales bacterium]|nr:thermonuclease family protein [Myxococcales bacterium]